ncbi:MAG: proteasome subunit beta [Candidatus Woesearchaeota archaeon]
MEENKVLKGTTTVGIVCKDGIVLGADMRATAGNLIVNKETDKIICLTDDIAVTMAGTVSDAQLLCKYIKAELSLMRIRNRHYATVKEAANLMAGFVYSNIRKMSMIPGVSHFLMGGRDSTGCYLYDIFADGSLTEENKYVTSGSGSVFALGVMETLYKENMSVDEGVELALKALNAALQRDTYTGNGVNIVTITKKGVKKEVRKLINTGIKA